jgi:hypothetical protein
MNGEKTGMIMLDQECSLFSPLYPVFVYSNLSLETQFFGRKVRSDDKNLGSFTVLYI